MISAEIAPFASAFPADDEADNARWLASLITALRGHAERVGHPEVAAALDDALAAAQTIAEGGTEH